MVTGNPYLENGLEYPIPERLIGQPEKESKYGEGRIVRRGPQSYHIYYSKKYVCACRTYEHAWYTRKRLRECGWDKTQLPMIEEEYPEWYTWLMNFYKYIMPSDKTGNFKEGKWVFNLTPKRNGKLEQLLFKRLEDALWERDLYVKYGFDVELVVYYADDECNPYYDMDLPPYPERKIRRISDRDSHQRELDELAEYMREGVGSTLKDFCRLTGYCSASVRNWLGNYGVNLLDFKRIVLSGEDPWSVLELEPLVYTPDLSVHYQNKGYVHVRHRKNGEEFFCVIRKKVYYGGYPSRELADRVVEELGKCGWDKSKMDVINWCVGFESANGRRYIHFIKSGGYYRIGRDGLRRGKFYDLDLAILVRDLLWYNDWDWNRYDEFESLGGWIHHCIGLYESSFIKRGECQWIIKS